MDLDDLPLGRIATNDFSYCRVIDRMLMYERRIENSLHKTLRELERRQIIRQFQQQEAEQQFEPSPSLRDEAATRRDVAATRGEKNSDLKKQSQFAPGLIGATPFIKGFYDKVSTGGEDENKAKQSEINTVESIKGVEKRVKSLEAATG
jgi:hypothetical protein